MNDFLQLSSTCDNEIDGDIDNDSRRRLCAILEKERDEGEKDRFFTSVQTKCCTRANERPNAREKTEQICVHIDS